MAILVCTVVVSLCLASASGAGERTLACTDLPQDEKEARTPAQQKINSQLLYEIYRRRGEAQRKGVPPGNTLVRIDHAGRALVDVRAHVTAALERQIRRLGGRIVTTTPSLDSIVAWMRLLKLERLAENPAVRAIEPAATAMSVR